MALDIQLPLSHPGSFVENWILPDGITISEAAKLLKVSRQTLDALVNGRRGISPQMAIKLETVFGGTARHLLAMQVAYDLEQAYKKVEAGLKPHRTHPSLRDEVTA